VIDAAAFEDLIYLVLTFALAAGLSTTFLLWGHFASADRRS
jgi:hypothetical protein